MKLKALLMVLLGLVVFPASAQIPCEDRKPDYLGIQTGVMIDRYNSLGIRTYFEFEKNIKGNWHYGISYEHTAHVNAFATDHDHDLPTNLSLLSFNGYYHFPLYKDRLILTTGVGLGLLHANWNTIDHFGFTANVSATLNIRVSKRVYLQTFLLPVNRFYYSNMKANVYQDFYAFSLFPVGIKVKL